jgi:hypothetical protein
LLDPGQSQPTAIALETKEVRPSFPHAMANGFKHFVIELSSCLSPDRQVIQV